MVTKLDYEKNKVEACFSVLLELMTLLGEFRDNIVLIGGWIPYFLLPGKSKEHTGSMDIDLALDFKEITDDTYNTILQLLQEHGYEQDENQPFMFYRTILLGSGNPIKVKVDLLAGEYDGTGKAHRHQKVQDVLARKARGSDLVFQHNISIKISGTMPDGAENEITIKIAHIVPFLVMKGMALWECLKEKHAYDIYFTVLNYPGGIDELAKQFNPYISNKLVREGLGKIKAKFININFQAPVWVVSFLGISDTEERERVQRDSFERVNALLDALGIVPYEQNTI